MYAGASYAAAPYASPGDTARLWNISAAKSSARAKPVNWLTYWLIAPGRASMRAFPVTFREVWLIASASAAARAKPIELSGAGTANFNLTKAQATARGNQIHWLRWFDLASAKATAKAHPFSWLLLLQLRPAKAAARGLPVDFTASGTVNFDLATAKAIARGWPVDFNYVPITTVPDLVVSWEEGGESAEIDVRNPQNAQLSLIRAHNYLSGFADPVLISPGDIPWSDTGLDSEESYMYRASYTIEGEKGGEQVVIEGELSGLRILIGKNRTL